MPRTHASCASASVFGRTVINLCASCGMWGYSWGVPGPLIGHCPCVPAIALPDGVSICNLVSSQELWCCRPSVAWQQMIPGRLAYPVATYARARAGRGSSFFFFYGMGTDSSLFTSAAPRPLLLEGEGCTSDRDCPPDHICYLPPPHFRVRVGWCVRRYGLKGSAVTRGRITNAQFLVMNPVYHPPVHFGSPLWGLAVMSTIATRRTQTMRGIAGTLLDALALGEHVPILRAGAQGSICIANLFNGWVNSFPGILVVNGRMVRGGH